MQRFQQVKVAYRGADRFAEARQRKAENLLLNFLQKFNKNLTDRLWKKERIAFNKKRFHMGVPDRPTRLAGDKSIIVWGKIIIKI